MPSALNCYFKWVLGADLKKKTNCSIVDSYHYINHCTTDYICQKLCNSAPLNSSASDLVASAVDKTGPPYLKRAFNTHVQYSSLEYIFYN